MLFPHHSTLFHIIHRPNTQNHQRFSSLIHIFSWPINSFLGKYQLGKMGNFELVLLGFALIPNPKNSLYLTTFLPQSLSPFWHFQLQFYGYFKREHF
jgi:hypothetical protein